MAAERAAQQTLWLVARQCIEQHSNGWSNATHAAQWTAALKTDPEPVLGQLLARAIATAHVIQVLDPIWPTGGIAKLRQMSGKRADHLL